MSKIRTGLKILKKILQEPSSIRAVILFDQKPEYGEEYVIKKYGMKSGLPAIDFIELFPNYDEVIKPLSFLPQGSGLLDYALLKGLAQRFENCRYLEIGTWRGESIANIALVSKECISVSLSDEQMKKLGCSEDYIKTSRFFSKNLPNIKHIEHDSQTFDFSELEKFDLIFVDGEHSYKSVKKDTENVFQLLKNDSSIIVWHDYVDTEGLIRWDILAAILDGYPESQIPRIHHVSNTLCAVYLPTDFKPKNSFNPLTLNKIFEVKLSAHKISTTT